jgi:hypothetical protein
VGSPIGYDRQCIGRYFLEHIENTGIKLRGVEALKVRYVESYIVYRKSLNLSLNAAPHHTTNSPSARKNKTNNSAL